MKKSSVITILVIFILPIALYFFFKVPSESNISVAYDGANKPKVLQFSSAMCYDCKRLEKEITLLRQEYSSKIIFRKYNASTRTSQVNELISKYNINVVPTLIFLDKNGNFVRKTEGYVTQSQLRSYLNQLIQ